MQKGKNLAPTVTEQRDEVIAQGNDLIRQARFSLTALEQNIVYFAMSKIGPNDKDFMRIHFTVAEFCHVCGIYYEDNPGGREYKRIKSAIKSLADKSVWVKFLDGSEVLVRWFDICRVKPNTGEISIIFSLSVKPYLIGLIERAKSGGEGYTQILLLTQLALQSKYSKRMYEVLKSYLYSKGTVAKLYLVNQVEYELSEFKKLMNAECYDRFPDLRRKVLETAVREINEVSDIDVSYQVVTRSRKVVGVRFTFHHKEINDRLLARQAAITALDGPREKIKKNPIIDS